MAVLLGGCWQLSAHLTKTPESFLAARFAACRIGRHTLRLPPEKRLEIKREARVSFVASRYVWFRIDCQKSGRGIRLAFLDRHRVRTHKEIVLVVLSPSQRVEIVQVLDFHEPKDYFPPARWLELLKGKSAQDAVSLGSDLSAISGATMTSIAVSSAVRRALHLRVLAKNEP